MSTVQLANRAEHAEWRLTFGRLLRSEWIKLRTLRSTVWCAILVVVFLVGIPALGSAFSSPSAAAPVDEQRSLEVTIITAGVLLAQLIVAVMGVLAISGEYGTGMIRSSLAAAPRRVSAIVAKLIVLVVATFLLSVLSLAAAAGVASLLLPGKGLDMRLTDPLVWAPILGTAVYLALIAAFAFSVGALVRNSAGGISITLGVLLVLPGLLVIFAALTRATWLTDVERFLPSVAGGRLYAYIGSAAASASDSVTLMPWQGGLVLLGWVIVLGGLATLLIKNRDA